jgi:hypothetical protein
MKAYGGKELQPHAFLTSVQMKVSGELHAPAALHRGKEPPLPFG